MRRKLARLRSKLIPSRMPHVWPLCYFRPGQTYDKRTLLLSSRKQLRNDGGYWQFVEGYHSDKTSESLLSPFPAYRALLFQTDGKRAVTFKSTSRPASNSELLPKVINCNKKCINAALTALTEEGGRHWGCNGSCSIKPSLSSPPMLKPSILSVKPSFATIQSKLIDWGKAEICPTNVYVHSLVSLLAVSLINWSSGVFSASTTFLQYGLQNRQVNLLYPFRATHLA